MWTDQKLNVGAQTAVSAVSWFRWMVLALMLLGLGLALAGCTPVQSLSPFFESNDVVFDQSFLGEWVSKADDGFWMKLRFEHQRQEDDAYSVEAVFHADQVEEGKPQEGSITFSVHLFQVEGCRFLDFYPLRYSAKYGGHNAEFEASDNFFAVPTHTVYRVNLGGREIRLAWLDDTYVKQFIEKNQLALTTTDSGPFVLVGRTGELKAALLAHAEQEGLLERDEIVLTRKE